MPYAAAGRWSHLEGSRMLKFAGVAGRDAGMLNENVVLLFFKDFERDSYFRNDRYIKRLVKPLFNRFRRTQKVSGFLVWYQLLVRALKEQGYDVRLNDYKAAAANPNHPVGLVGYPHLLDDWSLPNPAVLGPALLNHPLEAPHLMDDSRFRTYVVTCDWMHDQFAPVFGPEKTRSWYAGIDLERWPDSRSFNKTTDVLIYDKIRWNRERYEPELLDPIRRELDARSLTHQTIRYGAYDHDLFADQLARSRSMVFLCEHETQGMAYQEALASNVPIMAWDQGEWLDPNRSRFSPNPIPATSVPHWSPQCGEKFANIDGFREEIDRFWSQLDNYEPRQFVGASLSFRGSAELYMTHYRAAAT